jgi:hypothetical protein
VSWVNLTDLGATGTTDYGCGVGFAANIAQPIFGANDSNPYSGSCIPSDNYARGDILVLRRAGLDLIPPRRRFRRPRSISAPSTSRVGVLGPDAPAEPANAGRGPSARDRRLLHQPVDQFVDEKSEIPALYRMTLGDGPAMTAQLIASGIENMQVQYGVTHRAARASTTRPTCRHPMDERRRRAHLAARAQHDPRARLHQHVDLHDGRPDGHRQRRVPAAGVPAGRAVAQLIAIAPHHERHLQLDQHPPRSAASRRCSSR